MKFFNCVAWALVAMGPVAPTVAYITPRWITTFRQVEISSTPPSLISLSSGYMESRTVMQMTTDEGPAPSSFREAEILGLRLMQEGKFEDALAAFEEGMKLPGSRQDVIRTKSLSGPSPVGGSYGGTESQNVQLLDEFELQAAHYNMACAHARLGNLNDSIANLAKAFDFGFDNYSTVRGDPDLDPIKQEPDFLKLLDSVEPKKRFMNPFGMFNK